MLLVCIFGPILWAFSVLSFYALEVMGEPAMSQSVDGYPVAESSGEEAFRTCIGWCTRWVTVWEVWSSVEILQSILLDECSYCGFQASSWLFYVLNECEDIVEYSIDLEVRSMPLVHCPRSCIVACSYLQVVGLGSVPVQ